MPAVHLNRDLNLMKNDLYFHGWVQELLPRSALCKGCPTSMSYQHRHIHINLMLVMH